MGTRTLVVDACRVFALGFKPLGRVYGFMPTVQTGDVDTYYERRGEGPPVVFVHAAALDHSMWDRQVDALASDYETVVYDVRGHGRPAGSAVPAYAVERYAESETTGTGPAREANRRTRDGG